MIQNVQIPKKIHFVVLPIVIIFHFQSLAKVHPQCDQRVEKIKKIREAMKNADAGQRSAVAQSLSAGDKAMKEAFQSNGGLANLAAGGAEFQQKLNEYLYGKCMQMCKPTGNDKVDKPGEASQKCQDFKKEAQTSAQDKKGAEDDAAKSKEGENQVDSEGENKPGDGQGQMPPIKPPEGGGDEGGGEDSSTEVAENELSTESNCATAEQQVKEGGAQANSILVEQCARFKDSDGNAKYALIAPAIEEEETAPIVSSDFDPRGNNIASLEKDVESFEQNYGYDSQPNSAASAGGSSGGGSFGLGGGDSQSSARLPAEKNGKLNVKPNLGPSLKVGGSGGGSSGGSRSGGGAAYYGDEDDSFDLMGHFMNKRNKKNMGGAGALFGGGKSYDTTQWNPKKTMPQTFESVSTGFFRYCLKFKHCPPAQLETMRRALK